MRNEPMKNIKWLFLSIYGDVTNGWLDDKLPQKGLKFFEIEITVSKKRIRN